MAAALLPVKLGSAALKSFSGSCTYTVVAVLFTVISLKELAAVAFGTMTSNVLGTPLPFEMKLDPGWAVWDGPSEIPATGGLFDIDSDPEFSPGLELSLSARRRLSICQTFTNTPPFVCVFVVVGVLATRDSLARRRCTAPSVGLPWGPATGLGAEGVLASLDVTAGVNWWLDLGNDGPCTVELATSSLWLCPRGLCDFSLPLFPPCPRLSSWPLAVVLL